MEQKNNQISTYIINERSPPLPGPCSTPQSSLTRSRNLPTHAARGWRPFEDRKSAKLLTSIRPTSRRSNPCVQSTISREFPLTTKFLCANQTHHFTAVVDIRRKRIYISRKKEPRKDFFEKLFFILYNQRLDLFEGCIYT